MPNDSSAHPSQLVIVGAGIAGLVAANRARQLGLPVRVLERSSEETYLCNTRISSGTLHVALHDIMSSPDVLRAAISATTSGQARLDLADALASTAARTVHWLQDEGVRFVRTGAKVHQNWAFAPPRRRRPGLDWEGRAGDVLLRTLEANLGKRGVQVERGHRVRELITEDGRCTGVEVETTSGRKAIQCDAVLLADGGFQSNSEMVRKYISSTPEKLMARNAGSGLGDGIQMAEKLGAAIVGTNRFYGHVLSRDAITNPQLWPYPYFDLVAAAAIVVGADGLRFADEGLSGVNLANAIAATPDPLGTFVIFDSEIWNTAGKEGLIPANPFIEEVGGTIYRCQTLHELAERAGIRGDALAQTVGAYNKAVLGNAISGLPLSRSSDRVRPLPIVRPPYFAAPLCAGMTYTMGGILTGTSGEVLREDGSAIEGLFAAGSTTGGLEGGPTAGYVGGLAKAAVFGLRVAERLAGKA